jgi:transposase
LVDDVAEATYWRERAVRAEARAEQSEERAVRAEERAVRAEARVAEALERVSELTEQVAVLGRIVFGRSSEKAGSAAGREEETPGGCGDGDEGGSAGGHPGERAEGAGGGRGKRGQRPGSVGHGRRDYSHVETREEIIDVPEGERVCGGCQRPFEVLDTQTSEQVDWRVVLVRVVYRRVRYRRRCDCAGPRTVTAPVPAKPVAKGRFTAGFLARLLHEKYVLGRPLHRIVRALRADGLDVAEGTLCGALKAVADLLVPWEEAIAARGALAVHTHADETSWRVFEQTEGKDGYRWWLWVFLTEDTVVFCMDPTRSMKVLERHFGIDRKAEDPTGGRRLLLSTDFYSAYQSLGRLEGVDPLWCWAHIRRYFIRAGDAHAQLRHWRDAWVSRIAELYLAHRGLAAEAPGTAAHTAAAVAFDQALGAIDAARREQAALHSLHPAARKVLATLDREWDGLARHRDYPDLDLDNNKAERALRNPVVGRKNYYGSQAQWAAHLAARIWTISATLERHHREPLTALTDYLQACAANGGKPLTGDALQRFLPWTPTTDRDDDPPHTTEPGPSP